jgi:large subunit ribosomal protein L9
MKVLLKEDVDNLGYAGEVYKVADGYGRNYLIPKGLAVKATPSVMKQADVWRKKAEARREELRAEYEALSVKIDEASLSYTARAGDTGKLYGSITTSQITDDLNELLGTDIDRRKVGVEPLRQLGEHKVIVRLSAEFQPNVTVIIESEDGTPFVAEDADIADVEEADGAIEEIEAEIEFEEAAVEAVAEAVEAVEQSEEPESIDAVEEIVEQLSEVVDEENKD